MTVLLAMLMAVMCAAFPAVEVKPINKTPLKPVTAPKIGNPVLGKIPGQVVVPEKFGNVSFVDAKAKAYPCGTVMASYNGIEAYSNGEYQGTGDSCGDWSSTGLQFQCVEYTQRYFNYLYGVAPVWPVNWASQMCDSHPAGVCPVGYPAEGFGVVFGWGGYGHTAVVIGVGSSTIDVIEQNGSPYGTNSYWQSDVLCYLAPC